MNKCTCKDIFEFFENHIDNNPYFPYLNLEEKEKADRKNKKRELRREILNLQKEIKRLNIKLEKLRK